jgi:hypothetical protein
MNHDYEDLSNPDDLDDIELRELVRERIRAHGLLDIDEITVQVKDGRVTLSGQVGTEGERRVAERVLTDDLGVTNYHNDLVINQLHRGESPEPIDEHLADEEERAGTLLGEAPQPQDPEAEYYAKDNQEDLAGTTDYEDVMANGKTWNPPSGPTPEGMAGTDARPEDMGERH